MLNFVLLMFRFAYVLSEHRIMAEQTTSKELILARINSDRQYAHFKSWKEGEKSKAIGDCGLAKHRYGNKGE